LFFPVTLPSFSIEGMFNHHTVGQHNLKIAGLTVKQSIRETASMRQQEIFSLAPGQRNARIVQFVQRLGLQD
jgi:hypothetical protein